MSALQLALGLSRTNNGGNITLLRRRPSPIHAYDADPGFLGLKKGPLFAALSTAEDRRKLIDSARWPGSVSRDLSEALDFAGKNGSLELLTAEVVSAEPDSAAQSVHSRESGQRLHLSNGQTRRFNRVILATGFVNDLPQRPWISSLAEEEGLKTHNDGYPLPSASLEWTQGLFVSGGLAELEAGPSELNIIGAHKAHEKMRFAISEKL